MAPAGWYIQERIGWPLWKIHGPVPLWDAKLKKAMEKQVDAIFENSLLTD